jgi:hypothetical protein
VDDLGSVTPWVLTVILGVIILTVLLVAWTGTAAKVRKHAASDSDPLANPGEEIAPPAPTDYPLY